MSEDEDKIFNVPQAPKDVTQKFPFNRDITSNDSEVPGDVPDFTSGNEGGSDNSGGSSDGGNEGGDKAGE